MIARATRRIGGTLGGMASGAVLLREAARTSRRWQTYVGRAAFSAVLMAMLLLGIWFAGQVAGAGNLAWMGRALFIAFTVLQVMLAVLVAPMVVARAVIEERLDGTLALLVLTPLRPGQLLGAKILSRLLILLTLVLGTLPLMALVVTLGGVGIFEVVVVTLGTLVAAAVMGTMGGFFALFTRQPLIATLAALGWGLLAFLVMPSGYATMIASPWGFSHVSPLFGSASQDWWALLVIPTYIPVFWLVFKFATPLFHLRMADAELRRYFSEELWQTRRFLWAGLVFGIASIVWFPVAMGVAWWSVLDPGVGEPWEVWGLWLGGGLARGLAWLWTIGVMVLSTWVYLRLGMDLVDALDGFLDRMGRGGAKKRGMRIWNNPVMWRESRLSAWGSGGLPLLVGWLFVLFGIFQTGWWVIPGGILTVGAVNAVAALGLTAWSGAGTIETERSGRTLEQLVVSTLSAWRIAGGKLVAIAFPTLPMLIVAIGLIIAGYPHLALITDRDNLLGATGDGVLAGLWLVPAWLVVAVGSMVIGMRARRAQSAYGLAIAATVSALVLAPAWAWLFSGWYLVALPGRVLVPLVVYRPQVWEYAISYALLTGAAAVLFALFTLRLRQWSGRALR